MQHLYLSHFQMKIYSLRLDLKVKRLLNMQELVRLYADYRIK